MLASSFSTRFLLRKNRRSRLPAPLGPLFCRPRHGCAAPGPQRQNPGPPRFQLGFCCAKIGAAGYRPHLLGLPRKSARGISLRETTLCGCPLRGHGFATPHRCFAVPVTAPPRRVPNGKTPALAPIRSHFACGETAQPVIGPTGADVLPSPSRLRRAGSPTAKPRRLLPFGRISPAAKPRSRSSAPPGPMFCRPRHGCAAPGPQRQNPGPPRFQSGFFYAKTGGRSPPLSDGGALTKSENIILCASSCHPPRSPYPHCTLPHVRFSGIGQKKKPQRKTAAAVAYHSLFLSFRLCGTRSPACFVIRIHSTSLSSRGENKKGKRARFPFLLCSERLISARSAFSLFFPAPVPDAARLIHTHTLPCGTTLPPPPAPSRSAFQ